MVARCYQVAPSSRHLRFSLPHNTFSQSKSATMNSVPVFQELFDYNYWARDRQLEACAALTPEEFIRPLSNSFPSLRDTLAHLLRAEWLWLERWNGRFPHVREYLAGLSEDSLYRPLTYTNMKGENCTYPLLRILFHVIHHQTYPRGPVTT